MDEVDGLAGPDGARGIRTYRGLPHVAADASASRALGSSLRCFRPGDGTLSGTSAGAPCSLNN